MKNILLTISGLMSLLLTTAAFAHPGHDHGHWMSQFIHSILFAVLAFICAFGIDWLIVHLSTNNNSKERSNNHVS